jgi:hypothetical protein
MLQIDMPMDLTFGGGQQKPITFQPEPEFLVVSNNQFSSNEDNPLNIGLRDLKDLMTRYQTCVVNSDSSLVSSGGVQQFLNRLIMKKKEMSDILGGEDEVESQSQTSFMDQEQSQMDEAILMNMPVSLVDCTG